MSAEYRLLQRVTLGLIRVERTDEFTGRTSEALWSCARVAKAHRCVVLDAPIAKGCLAYRPVGNQAYRYERISTSGVAVLQVEAA